MRRSANTFDTRFNSDFELQTTKMTRHDNYHSSFISRTMFRLSLKKKTTSYLRIGALILMHFSHSIRYNEVNQLRTQHTHTHTLSHKLTV